MITDDIVYNAMIHLQNGEFLEAANGFEEYLKKDQKQVQVMGELCYCYLELGRFEDTEKLASKALLISQNRGSRDNIGRFYGYLAKTFYQRKSYEQAVKYFRLAIANKPNFMPNYQEMAYCLFWLGEYKKAIDAFNEIIRQNSDYAKEYDIYKKIEIVKSEWYEKDSVRYLSSSGFQYQQEKNIESAKEEYNRALKLDSDNLISLYGLFSIAQQEGEINKAIELGEKLVCLLDKIENLDSEYMKPPVFIGLSIMYSRVQDFDRSAEYGQWFATTEHFKKMEEALKKLDIKEALAQVKEAFEIRPDSYEALSRLINLLLLMNKPQDALIAIKKAFDSIIKLDKKDKIPLYYQKVGLCYETMKDYENAIKYYSLAENNSSDVDFKLKLNHLIAVSYSNLGGHAQNTLSALKECEKLIENGAIDIYDIPSMIIKQNNVLDKNSDLNKANDHFNSGVKFFNEKKFPEAVKELELSLELIPQDVEVMNVLTRAYFITGKQKEACEVAEEGFKVSMRDGDTRYLEIFAYNIGNHNYNIGNFEKALKYYTHALKLNPKDDDYIYFVNACKKKLGIL